MLIQCDNFNFISWLLITLLFSANMMHIPFLFGCAKMYILRVKKVKFAQSIFLRWNLFPIERYFIYLHVCPREVCQKSGLLPSGGSQWRPKTISLREAIPYYFRCFNPRMYPVILEKMPPKALKWTWAPPSPPSPRALSKASLRLVPRHHYVKILFRLCASST